MAEIKCTQLKNNMILQHGNDLIKIKDFHFKKYGNKKEYSWIIANCINIKNGLNYPFHGNSHTIVYIPHISTKKYTYLYQDDDYIELMDDDGNLLSTIKNYNKLSMNEGDEVEVVTIKLKNDIYEDLKINLYI